MPDELFISQFMATLTRLIYLEENQSVVREEKIMYIASVEYS